MSGSGATVFGLYGDCHAAAHAAGWLKRAAEPSLVGQGDDPSADPRLGAIGSGSPGRRRSRWTRRQCVRLMQNSTASRSARLHRAALGKQREGVAGHLAVMARPLDRVLDRPMPAQDLRAPARCRRHRSRRARASGARRRDRLVVTTPEGEDDRQRDLALAEIVADVLAERGPPCRRNRGRRRRAGRRCRGSFRRTGRPPARPSDGRRSPVRPRRRPRTAPPSCRGSPPGIRPRSSRRVFAADNCRTSPSAITVAAEDRMASAGREPTSTIILKAWPSRKSPTSTLASLPHFSRAAIFPRRMVEASTTSSCRSVAVCMNSTAAARLTWPSPRIAGERLPSRA